MVSNARLDFPEPDRPVKTIMASRGRSRLTSLRLCSRAPRTISRSFTQTLSVGAVRCSGHFESSDELRQRWRAVAVSPDERQEASDQSTALPPCASSAAFARLNGREPKKPLEADSGL